MRLHRQGAGVGAGSRRAREAPREGPEVRADGRQDRQGPGVTPETLEDEKLELEEKLEDAEGKAKKKLERKLDQNEKATENLDKAKLETPSQSTKDAAYKLSDDEIERVTDHEQEIRKVFEEAEYLKSSKKKKDEKDDE